ncbi:MAG: S1 RNA-binding domain-containing protein, partial [Acutalibacteraceae bacterium]|nr:S1 RNA-binding domain-containing protein [Acutalibacteraceae bacterium]
VYTGTVKSLTSYGAFVDIGGVDGMIHISELSWNRIKHPSEVVKVGDTVEVYVKDIDTEKNNISLGYKKTEDNPWEIMKNNYPVDTVTEVEIVGLTQFGAFAKIIPGIDGLIHISQIANRRIEKPQDELTVGQKVQAKITAVDLENKRVSLSIRALLQDEEPAEAAEEAEATEE